MIHQTLIYVSSEAYAYGLMELAQQRQWFPKENGVDTEGDSYIDRFRDRHRRKQTTQLHIVKLALDPINGTTEILINEYAQNPLKTKIIINAAAKAAPVTDNSAALSALIQSIANQQNTVNSTPIPNGWSTLGTIAA